MCTDRAPGKFSVSPYGAHCDQRAKFSWWQVAWLWHECSKRYNLTAINECILISG